MDQETVRLLCIAGYVVIGLVALYSALTFILALVSVIQEAAPNKALQLVNVNAPRPRGDSMKPDLREFIVLLVVFLACWYYAGDAGDMPHHLLRVTAYVVGAWVVFSGVGIAYIVTLRGVVWWRWTQAVVALHEKRLAEESQGEARLASTSQPGAHLDPVVFHNREVRRELRAQARLLRQAERRYKMAIIRSHPWHTTIVLTLLGIAGVLFWTVPPKLHPKAEPAWQAWPIGLIVWILVVYLWRFEELIKKSKTDTNNSKKRLASDIFRVHCEGNEYTSTIRSAAELTLQHGYRYFVLLPQKEATQQSPGLLIRCMHTPESFGFDAYRLQQALKV